MGDLEVDGLFVISVSDGEPLGIVLVEGSEEGSFDVVDRAEGDEEREGGAEGDEEIVGNAEGKEDTEGFSEGVLDIVGKCEGIDIS